MSARLERFSSDTLPQNHRRISHLSFETFSQQPRLPVAGTAAHFRHREREVSRSQATSEFLLCLHKSRPDCRFSTTKESLVNSLGHESPNGSRNQLEVADLRFVSLLVVTIPQGGKQLKGCCYHTDTDMTDPDFLNSL